MKRFILLALLVLLTGCDQDSQQAVTETHEDVVVRQLAAKYQAIILWEEHITYTIQAQERLTAGKPTLFTGSVDDVFHRKGKLFVRFSSFSYPGFVFELECSPSIVETILTQKPFVDYAVVANIQEVSRPVFALRASPLSEDDAEIEISTSYTKLIAKGTCIEVASVSAK